MMAMQTKCGLDDLSMLIYEEYFFMNATWVLLNKYSVLSSCDGDPFTNQREPTWVDQTSGDPVGVILGA
jgi:hypothetical protein